MIGANAGNRLNCVNESVTGIAPDEIEQDSYIDELLTDGFHAVYDPLDELFGEPIAGYSLQ